MDEGNDSIAVCLQPFYSCPARQCAARRHNIQMHGCRQSAIYPVSRPEMTPHRETAAAQSAHKEMRSTEFTG